MPFISSFKIINVVCFAKSKGWIPDPNIFLWMDASVADVATVNPNGIKTLSANGLSVFFIKSNPVFNDCPISCNWVLITLY